jgi:hypothetical protein
MVQVLGLDSYLAVGLRGVGRRAPRSARASSRPVRCSPTTRESLCSRSSPHARLQEVERRHRERALRASEAAQRALAEEQAALRRVATLAAADAPTRELLDTVASEVGR